REQQRAHHVDLRRQTDPRRPEDPDRERLGRPRDELRDDEVIQGQDEREQEPRGLYPRLLGADVTVRSEPVTWHEAGAWDGVRVLYAIDPDGTWVELPE